MLLYNGSTFLQAIVMKGSGCASVGGAFISENRIKTWTNRLYDVNCVEKTIIKEKEAGIPPPAKTKKKLFWWRHTNVIARKSDSDVITRLSSCRNRHILTSKKITYFSLALFAFICLMPSTKSVTVIYYSNYIDNFCEGKTMFCHGALK